MPKVSVLLPLPHPPAALALGGGAWYYSKQWLGSRGHHPAERCNVCRDVVPGELDPCVALHMQQGVDKEKDGRPVRTHHL